MSTPGQHDLFRAAVDLARNGVADQLERQRAARSARLPDRAESAAVVAAGLDGDEASDVALKARWRHDVICGKALSLLAFPTTRVTPGMVCEGRWIELRRAAGDQDFRRRAAARCARRIAWRVWRTASLVTAQLLTTIQSSSGRRGARDRLALGEVEAATERDGLDAHCSASRSSSPSKTCVALPRMRIGSPGAQR